MSSPTSTNTQRVLNWLSTQSRPQTLNDMVDLLGLSPHQLSAACSALTLSGQVVRTKLDALGRPNAYRLPPHPDAQPPAPDSPQSHILATLREAGRPISLSLLRSRLLRPCPDLNEQLLALERAGQVTQVDGRWRAK